MSIDVDAKHGYTQKKWIVSNSYDCRVLLCITESSHRLLSAFELMLKKGKEDANLNDYRYRNKPGGFLRKEVDRGKQLQEQQTVFT